MHSTTAIVCTVCAFVAPNCIRQEALTRKEEAGLSSRHLTLILLSFAIWCAQGKIVTLRFGWLSLSNIIEKLGKVKAAVR